MTSSRDQISKASWTLVESIKDSVSTNVVAASQTGQIDLKNLNLDRLLTIINASIEAGHQRATKAFLHEVDKVVATATPAPPAKKK